jgi:hypothetical protein
VEEYGCSSMYSVALFTRDPARLYLAIQKHAASCSNVDNKKTVYINIVQEMQSFRVKAS